MRVRATLPSAHLGTLQFLLQPRENSTFFSAQVVKKQGGRKGDRKREDRDRGTETESSELYY